jgi:quercetin dioxygenase-like cupin family protein
MVAPPMSRPNVTQRRFGTLHMTIHDFAEVGDELPLHSHPDGLSHVSFVNRGSFRSFGDGWERTMKPGDMVLFAPDQQHGFTALEPNSRLTNIRY